MNDVKLIKILDKSAFDLVDGKAFDDNGGEPDGNALLQDVTVIDGYKYAVLSGKAEIVDGLTLADADLKAYQLASLVGDLPDNIGEMMQNEISNAYSFWCHYGAYGALDSMWYVSE